MQGHAARPGLECTSFRLAGKNPGCGGGRRLSAAGGRPAQASPSQVLVRRLQQLLSLAQPLRRRGGGRPSGGSGAAHRPAPQAGRCGLPVRPDIQPGRPRRPAGSTQRPGGRSRRRRWPRQTAEAASSTIALRGACRALVLCLPVADSRCNRLFIMGSAQPPPPDRLAATRFSTGSTDSPFPSFPAFCRMAALRLHMSGESWQQFCVCRPCTALHCCGRVGAVPRPGISFECTCFVSQK